MFHFITNPSRVSRSLMTATALLALALAGCAGTGASRSARPADPAAIGAVFKTIDGAALDALAALRNDRSPATRGRFRVGRILAVPGGYTWEAPAVASPGPRPVVRLSSGPEHVATYMARDTRTSGTRAKLERHYERLERSLVERRDAQHRPLYVLTGTGEALAYRWQTEQEGLPAFTARDERSRRAAFAAVD